MITDVVMPDGMDGLRFRMPRNPLSTEQLGQAVRRDLGALPRIVVDNTQAP